MRSRQILRGLEAANSPAAEGREFPAPAIASPSHHADGFSAISRDMILSHFTPALFRQFHTAEPLSFTIACQSL